MGDRSKESLGNSLWRSTENIGRFLDNSPDSTFVSRIDNFRFVDVNKSAIENYGYSREEFLQMQIFDIEVEAPLREQVLKLYNETQVGEVIEVTGVNRRKDGSTFPVHVRFCKLDDEYAVANVHDTTLEKQADEEVERRVEKAIRLISNHKVGTKVAASISLLSDREIEVFTLIGRGVSPLEIAEELCISVRTVNSHREHIKNKLNLKHIRALILYAGEWVKDAGLLR